MATKFLQIIDSSLKNADTLDGLHAEDFAAASDVDKLQAKVGDTSVAEQISAATVVINESIATKADTDHTHDGRYYTESEIDAKLNNKANADHTHEISDIGDLSDASVGHAATAGTANSVAWDNVADKPSTYTPDTHSHAILDIINLQSSLDAKVPISRTINGKVLSADIILSASDVGADVSGAASSALTNAKAYADSEIAEWVGDSTVSEQIANAIATKADVNHNHKINDLEGVLSPEKGGLGTTGLEEAKELIGSVYRREGSIVTGTSLDGLSLEVKTLLAPVQVGSGDPYPAGGGKNLMPQFTGETKNGVTISSASDGTVVLNGTATAQVAFAVEFGSPISAGEYAMSITSNIANGYVQIWLENTTDWTTAGSLSAGALNNKIVFETEKVYHRAKLVVYPAAGELKNMQLKIQLERGSTVTAYAPYSNIRPISGHTGAKVTRCGKNLLKYPYKSTVTESNGLTFEYLDDGRVHIKGTAAASKPFMLQDFAAGNRAELKPGTYTISGNPTTAFILELYVYEDQTAEKPVIDKHVNGGIPQTFTIDETMYYGAYIWVTAGTTIDAIIAPQLELSFNATEYEPYQGETFTVDFGQTVYGGVLDWNTGKLTVDTGYAVFDGGENWVQGVIYQQTERYRYLLDIPGMKLPTNNATKAEIISSHYPVITAQDSYTKTNLIGVSVQSDTTDVQFRDENWVSAGLDAWKAYLATQYAAGTPVQIAYKLAEPYTIQLTPQEILALKGTNTVYSDSGSVIVDFNRDIQCSVAGTDFGLVKSGGDVTITDGIITVNDDSHNHTIANVDGLQSTLNGISDLVGDTSVSTQISNAIGAYTVQKDGTGASGTWGINITGNANSASKLGTSTIGNSQQPIHLVNGTPTLCSRYSNRIYDYDNCDVHYFRFGGGQDLNWKKVAAFSHPAGSGNGSGEYIGATAKGIIYRHKGNYSQAEVDEYAFQMNMCFVSNGNTEDSCILRTAVGCPEGIIRAVRVGTNSFELQIGQMQDWEKISIQFSVNGGAENIQVFEPTNSSNNSVIPSDILSNSVVYRSLTCYGNSETATRLQTPRTIFGKQSFNGTGDIAGRALFYGTYNADAMSRYNTGAIEIKENDLVENSQSDNAYAPQIGFHWTGRQAGQLALHNDGKFAFITQNGNAATVKANLEGHASSASKIYISESDPTTYTTRPLTVASSWSHENQDLNYNDALVIGNRCGTSSESGVIDLLIGNSTKAGVAGNKSGNVVLYGNNAGFTALMPQNHTDDHVYLSLPTTNGTLALESHTHSASDIGAQPALGYTPVQQGSGVDQGSNAVKIGWATDGSGLKCTVDSTDLGYIYTSSVGKNIIDAIYPVGSIYMSTNSTSPATLFGRGGWEQIQDRFLLAAGTTYSAGSTGGEATHTLTVDETPAHNHTPSNSEYSFGTYQGGLASANIARKPVYENSSGELRVIAQDNNKYDQLSTHNATSTVGSNGAHNNMPPYLTVYMWKRIW